MELTDGVPVNTIFIEQKSIEPKVEKRDYSNLFWEMHACYSLEQTIKNQWNACGRFFHACMHKNIKKGSLREISPVTMACVYKR
jgi:hypothetical protein